MEETLASEYHGSSHASSVTDPTTNTVEHYEGNEKDAELTDQSSLFTAYHEEDRVRVITDEDYEDYEPKEDDSPATTHRNVSELVAALGRGGGNDMSEYPPELERRVRDFRLARQKRRQKYGEQRRWGIFGMYAHLASVRVDLEWAEDAAWRRNNDKPYLSWSDFDDARQQRLTRPWFTYFIIFACSFMMIVEFALNDWEVESLKTNPMIGPSADALIRAGARSTPKIVEGGQWFRIFSPLILHAGIIHYVINMAAWFFIGAAIEKSHGLKNVIILFIIPGVGGNILSALFLPQYISVGASGGIFGLIGGCLADITLNWKLLFIRDSEDDNKTFRCNVIAIIWLVLDIAINVLLGLTPFIDNFTHLGGLVYGLCCGWSALEQIKVGFFGVQEVTYAKLRTVFLRFFGLIVTIVLIIITSVVLATSDVGDNPCKGCRYISCVPFPFWGDNKWWSCDDCDLVQAMLFNTDGDLYYDRMDLECPDGAVEVIDISSKMVADPDGKDKIERQLPSYCRDYCDDVFK